MLAHPEFFEEVTKLSEEVLFLQEKDEDQEGKIVELKDEVLALRRRNEELRNKERQEFKDAKMAKQKKAKEAAEAKAKDKEYQDARYPDHVWGVWMAQRKAKAKAKSKSKALHVAIVQRQHVFVRWNNHKTRYFKATLARKNKDGTYEVNFEDGDKNSNVSSERIRLGTSVRLKEGRGKDWYVEN